MSVRRETRLLQEKKVPRTDKPNERYYELYNQPNFYQFGDNYHFTDDEGRRYQIATNNRDAFQNHLLRGEPDGPDCVQDGWGNVKLYVKLYRRQSQWFTDQQHDRPLVLYGRHASQRGTSGGGDGTKDDRDRYVVRITETHKPDYKHRTGQIYVSGLGPLLCRTLLATQRVKKY